MNKETGNDTSQQMLIETSQLLIKGNIMSWHETMIQLSNVSCISTRPLNPIMLPTSLLYIAAISFMLVVLFFASIIFKSIVGIIGLGSLVSGIVFGIYFYIHTWNKINEERKKKTVLSIVMNSGDNLQFVINNRDFLGKVLKVLEQIIIDGGVGKQNVAINIQGCEITGNAKVLNDINLL